MSHAVSLYTVRCHKPDSTKNDQYHTLNAIGSVDLFEVTKGFVEKNTSSFVLVENDKKIFKFDSPTFDQGNRVIFGWLRVGSYGSRAELIDVGTNKVEFKRGERHADVMDHYFRLHLPSSTVGLCMTHAHGGRSMKTLLSDLLDKALKEKVERSLQIRPLGYAQAFSAWQQAKIKELKVLQYKPPTDVADLLSSANVKQISMTIKPARKKFFGRFSELDNASSEPAKLVEVLSPLGSIVKADVQLGKKKRRFVVGNSNEDRVCEVEIESGVIQDEVMPTLSEINVWCDTLAAEVNTKLNGN